MSAGPSPRALRIHREACEKGELGYMDPDTGLFVMTSVYLASRRRCCGTGCRHCPFDREARAAAGRDPAAQAWPWRP